MNPTTSRRRFLRGSLGAAVALPWMESLAGAAEAVSRPTKMVHFYVPIGVVRRGFFPGEQDDVIPKGNLGNVMKSLGKQDPDFREGPLDSLTPTLEPLVGHRERVTLLTGMDRMYKHGTDVHAQCASCYLSNVAPQDAGGMLYPQGRTLDHVVADAVGQGTPFRTLELSCNSHRDNKESMYFDNVSWYGPGHVAPSVRDPRTMYRRLFSAGEAGRVRDVTDLVLEDARSLRRTLGKADRAKFEEYFQSVREIETQTARLEAMRSELAAVPFEEPPEARLPRGDYIRLMIDLMVVALQTGLTNVATFMVGPERWDTPYMFDGLFDTPRSHHMMSHNQTKMIGDLLKVDRFHMEQFAYLLDKLAAAETPGGGSLLDQTLTTYGSGLGDGSTHQYNDLPIVVAGGGAAVRHGRHVHMPEGTPLANLWLTQARLLGLDMARFADSDGGVEAVLA